ncbi:CDP-glucose 4,6-dehydratase [Clostridium chromiireducens]|uniref:CDP-glucose 4,6-dehydratase n=1 Tax=Clostridium chromiireducens TaxID=225345 RepID=A0A399ILH1_9CLOT|nr:CDP-glucose 4,6-dehydratase [Clostridium chromiireducens]RII33944.1 CDP-glucose 4,6-dehydratase [Clostridium chromiireducens]
MEGLELMLDFYNKKSVFITGNTGFKGSWLTKILIMAGAKVTGFSLIPNTNPSLFNIINIEDNINSIIGDIRDLEHLKKELYNSKPDIVFHLAAQPLVRESYKNPVYTYETNVIGTVNLLESIRNCKSVRSVVIVTTDKVYKNNEWDWGYREIDSLDGFDPYSNSKSCSELVTHSYINSFFSDQRVAISTARAGNVIGGGDFSEDRIIPDCIRAAIKKENILVRNPQSIRPYQHVFEALLGYLLIAEKQYDDKNFEGNYNIGPNEDGCVTTASLVETFCNSWGNINWTSRLEDTNFYESNLLKLDCSKIKNKLGWKPKLSIKEAIDLTIEWTKYHYLYNNVNKLTENQINRYFRI